MKILHLSDLHYKNDASTIINQQDIISGIIEEIKKDNTKNLDFIFFTGDLVFSGADTKDFQRARDLLFERLTMELNIPKENLIYCCGNHDVYRDQEMPAIRSYFDTEITDNRKLDKFVSNPVDSQFIESCKNIDNYNKFMKDYYSSTDDVIESLYSIHKREIDNTKVGIVTINTAWRSNSKEDKGQLFYPISLVDKILLELKDCERKCILMHHGLEYFKDFNSYELEDKIYDNFLYLFSGHIHKRKQSINISSHEGIFCCVTPATLTETSKNNKIGFSILDIDLEAYGVLINNYICDWQDKTFMLASDHEIEIPVRSEKKEQNDFRKLLRERYRNELNKANELFIAGQETEDARDFNELFSRPVLCTVPEMDLTYENPKKYNYDYESILPNKENYFIQGKNKCGKTSLLKKLQLLYLSNFSEYYVIPFYFDYKDYKSGKQRLNIASLVAREYKSSQTNFKKKLEYSRLVLLIDNFDREISLLNEEIKSFVSTHENITFVATDDLLYSKSVEKSYLDGIKFKKLFIYDITRTEIRALTNKWPNISASKKQFVIERIIQIFNQLNIPYNYWTVSLFLWVFEKTNELSIHNNVELIQLYIDKLLEKHKTAFNPFNKLNFDNYKLFLGELANFIVSNFNDIGNSIEYKELVAFIDKYHDQNVRFVIETKEIIDHMINRGIIIQKESGRYAFRLNAVFEYFIAYSMKQNEVFRKRILNDSKKYLSYSNELELYAGFERTDEEFLKSIFEKTQDVLKELNENYEKEGSTDSNLTSRLSSTYDMEKILKQLEESATKPLPPDAQDEMMDEVTPLHKKNTEVVKKPEYKEINLTPPVIEKFIFILSRVFRNIDQVKNDALVREIFDFILLSYCNFGFVLIDEAKGSEKIDSKTTQDKLILKLLKSFAPLIVQICLYNAIGQQNLERIILDKINSLKRKSKKNQYFIFLLYFLLIDLDVAANIKYLDQVIELIGINTLRSTSIFKLVSYLMFKAYDNPTLEKSIRKYIQELTLKINPKADLKHLHKDLELKHKQLLLKGTKNTRKKRK